MATVGQPDALRRITVHYGTDEADFDGLDDGLLGIVIGDVLQDQESLYQSILGARTSGPSENSRYYHGESSSDTVTAAASRTSDANEQIASDFEYARRLQEEMDVLTIETPPNDDEQDGMLHC